MGMAEGDGMIQDAANESSEPAHCFLTLIKNFHHHVALEHSVRFPSFKLYWHFGEQLIISHNLRKLETFSTFFRCFKRESVNGHEDGSCGNIVRPSMRHHRVEKPFQLKQLLRRDLIFQGEKE